MLFLTLYHPANQIDIVGHGKNPECCYCHTTFYMSSLLFILFNFCFNVFSCNSWLYCLQETLHNHPRHVKVLDEKIVDGKSSDVENGKELEDFDGSKLATEKAKRPLWRNREMIAAVCVYCLWALHSMAYSEVKILNTSDNYGFLLW